MQQNPAPAPQPPARDLAILEDEITELAAHLNAATYRLLALIREFDAHWIAATAAVVSPAAPRGITSMRTISATGPTAAKPGSTTCCYSAATIIAWCMKAATALRWMRRVCLYSAHHTAN